METKVLILPAYTLNNCLSTANVENYSLKNNPEVTKIVKATYSSVKKKCSVWSEIHMYSRPKSEYQYSRQALKNRFFSNFVVRKHIISQQPLHRYYDEQFHTVIGRHCEQVSNGGVAETETGAD